MKNKVLFLAIMVMMFTGCSVKPTDSDKPIRAFNIDFNWADGGAHGFAKPGMWADANPEVQFKWYEQMGCNAIMTMAISQNGWAWYKNGIVPEQPGLKYDFLKEMVRLGHEKNIKVFGYFSVGANNKWEDDDPDLAYHMDGLQIPLTNQYMDYLCASIEDAIKKSDMDGICLDWFYNPGGNRWVGMDKDPLPDIKWLPCEQTMYLELMNHPFPGKDKVSDADKWLFLHKAIDRAWKRMKDITKKTKPSCIIWLSCYNLNSKEIAGSDMLKELDWLSNEHGDSTNIEAIRKSIGPQTRLLTTLAEWNKQDLKKIVPYALKANVGLYGFARPVKGSYMPTPIDEYLSKPLDSFKGDELNIAILARVYNGLPSNYVKTK